MLRILFVCHGNICRSPMAESVCSYLAKRRGLEESVCAASAATHPDELGNPPHRGTVQKLREEGIPLIPHTARLLRPADGERFDYIIGMDAENLRHMRRILGERYARKISLLLDWTDTPRAVADPWYTGDFDAAYADIVKGVTALLDALFSK